MAGLCCLGVLLGLAACSSSGKPSGSTQTSSANTTSGATAAAAHCTGTPLKFAAIISESGPGAAGNAGMKDAINVATEAINKACTAHRPISISICNDQSDPNQSATCGRDAKSEGALALVGFASAFERGAEAAQLPLLLSDGGGSFAATSPTAYTPGAAFPIVTYGYVNSAKALGLTKVLYVTYDLPVSQFIGAQLQAVAKAQGLSYDSILYPATTTDFTTLAAEVAAKADSKTAIVLSATQLAPILSAFAAQGVTAAKDPIMALSEPPADQLESLGATANGLLFASAAYPYSDTSNPGIAQMHTEYAAAGGSGTGVSLEDVSVWAYIHMLADAVAKLTPAQLDALNPKTIVNAVVNASPYAVPEYAPFDYRHPAFTKAENATFAQFRVWGREGLVIRIENGTDKVVTDGFVDVTKPFTISSS
jgi:hypothetical protein